MRRVNCPQFQSSELENGVILAHGFNRGKCVHKRVCKPFQRFSHLSETRIGNHVTLIQQNLDSCYLGYQRTIATDTFESRKSNSSIHCWSISRTRLYCKHHQWDARSYPLFVFTAAAKIHSRSNETDQGQ